VQLSGSDAVTFLQGLVTNDVTVLGENCKALYSLMLNVQVKIDKLNLITIATSNISLINIIGYHGYTCTPGKQLWFCC